MDTTNFFLRSEDESEFIPMIPLNENENGYDKVRERPYDFLILPLRNTGLFSGFGLPITVDRDKSIKAVNESYKSGKLIGVIAQKDSSIEDPEPQDLCQIGTVARIIKLIKMPDGGTTVIIQGKRRFMLDFIKSTDPYFIAKGTLMPDDVLPSA